MDPHDLVGEVEEEIPAVVIREESRQARRPRRLIPRRSRIDQQAGGQGLCLLDQPVVVEVRAR
jgi:hypothetical protein